jgi:hypothetical protein
MQHQGAAVQAIQNVGLLAGCARACQLHENHLQMGMRSVNTPACAFHIVPACAQANICVALFICCCLQTTCRGFNTPAIPHSHKACLRKN